MIATPPGFVSFRGNAIATRLDRYKIRKNERIFYMLILFMISVREKICQ